MLTPRHEALLATLLGMTVGVSAFGIFVAIRDEPLTGGRATPVVTTPATPSASADGSLHAESLSFTSAPLALGGTAYVPADWTRSVRDGDETRFTHPSDLWMIRFNDAGRKRDAEKLVDERIRRVDGAPDFRVVSQEPDTLVYAYTRDGSPRMVLTRWVEASDDDKRSLVEITVAGRPQDAAGLAVVLAHATESFAPGVEPN